MRVEVLVARQPAAGPKRVLHVQSISGWAPSCIGPYAQSNALAGRGLVFFSGQIPLDPATMTLVQEQSWPVEQPDGWWAPRAQLQRTLLSCQRVAVAMGTDLPSAAVSLTIFHTLPTADLARLQGEGWVEAFLRGHVSFEKAAPEEAPQEAEPEEADFLGIGRRPFAQLAERQPGWDREFLDPVTARAPAVSSWVPRAVWVAVPALPRGSLVEIQPLALASGAGSTPELAAREAGSYRVLRESYGGGQCTLLSISAPSGSALVPVPALLEELLPSRSLLSTSRLFYDLASVAHQEAETLAVQMAEHGLAVSLVPASSVVETDPASGASGPRGWVLESVF